MKTDTFMATAAQVLPTLGIAFAIEVSGWYRAVLAQSPAADFERNRQILAVTIAGQGTNLAVGEVAAMSALLVHYPGWTVWIPLGLVMVSLIYALGGMIMVPVNRIRTTPRPAARPQTRARERHRR